MSRLAIDASDATHVVVDGRELDYFGGCGYLGLAHDARVTRALAGALATVGVSSGASRETSGNARAHDQLEADLAHWLEVRAALLLPEGYLANLALAQGLADDYEFALLDEAAHSSLFDAAVGARMRVHTYAHGDVDMLRKLLGQVDARRALVLSDSVFPSRGEIAPIAALSAAAAAVGALLVLDDCHGTGVIGARGRGAREHAGLDGEHVIVTSTLSKALGCYGGFLAGSRALIERVRTRSAAYFGSTPIPPAVAAAAGVALELAFASNVLLARLRDNIAHAIRCLPEHCSRSNRASLPVFAFELGTAEQMQAVHAALLAEGLLVPYMRYPGDAPRGNFRAVVTAAHTHAQIERLAAALARHVRSAT